MLMRMAGAPGTPSPSQYEMVSYPGWPAWVITRPPAVRYWVPRAERTSWQPVMRTSGASRAAGQNALCIRMSDFSGVKIKTQRAPGVKCGVARGPKHHLRPRGGSAIEQHFSAHADLRISLRKVRQELRRFSVDERPGADHVPAR